MLKLGEELGRLFEVGFNTGLLRALEAAEIAYPNADEYQQSLSELKLPLLVAALAERLQLADEQGRAIVRHWVLFFVTRGFVAGLTFWQEFQASLHTKSLTIRYLQMRFDNENALGTSERDEEEVFKSFLSQLGVHDPARCNYYSRRGRFLRADTLALIDTGRRGWRVLAVDLSTFTVEAVRQLHDLKKPEVLRRLLTAELSYVRSRGQFASLALDTIPGEMPFAEGLERYYHAFIREDKETVKLIQAGSYAYSFHQFLQEYSILDHRPVRFHVLGYSDRSINSMVLELADLPILERCAQLYQERVPVSQDWQEERARVLDTIASHAARAFGSGGRDFIQQLLAIRHSDTTEVISFREQLAGFVNTGGVVPPEVAARFTLNPLLSLRAAHATLIERALHPTHPARLLFLTGNPGIGKTTALVNFLHAHKDEGFLFLYASPRTQVNRDLLQKFERWIKPEDRIMTLYSTSSLIESHGGNEWVVAYGASGHQDEFRLGPVRFIPDRTPGVRSPKRDRLAQVSEDDIADVTVPNKGVLASVCEGIYEVLKTSDVQSVVATVSIQSLKKTSAGLTLKHFLRIFRNGYNERHNRVLWDQLQAMSSRTRHLFVMVDEITGDEAGSVFLSEMLSLFRTLGLLDPKSGFNTKIIIADASIVDVGVIQTHLGGREPERDKIYVRKAPPKVAALSEQTFMFENEQALVIGANSFPSSELNLLYRLYIEVSAARERANEGVRNRLEEGIAQDVLTLLRRGETDQVIVYLQDKARIGELIERIGEVQQALGQPWKQDEDYLEIHASLSDGEKLRLGQVQDKVRVVFMTSSASRGLSFPRARHLLVAIPGFAVEQNLMEIIQVIYRGRGQEPWESQPRTLLFYLAEHIVCDSAENRARAVQERLLTLLTLLLILKVSILTRIQGYGQIGTERVLMVPVGGKGLTTAGDSFGLRMENLLRALQSAIRQRPNDGGLREIHQQLMGLLSRGEVLLEQECYSYLQFMREFETHMVDALTRGFNRLLELPSPGLAYVTGGLLVVPLIGREVHEHYYLRLMEQIRPLVEEALLPLLYAKMHDEEGLPEGLRSQLRQAVDLVQKLTVKEISRSQRVVGQAEHPDLYYALPLWALVNHPALAAYFTSEPDEPATSSFRALLGQLVRAHHPSEGMLPIGPHYAEFPWILFRSHSLLGLRQRLFTGRQLLASAAFNVLNLILSREEPRGD
jgi:hypothetical protein